MNLQYSTPTLVKSNKFLNNYVMCDILSLPLQFKSFYMYLIDIFQYI